MATFVIVLRPGTLLSSPTCFFRPTPTSTRCSPPPAAGASAPPLTPTENGLIAVRVGPAAILVGSCEGAVDALIELEEGAAGVVGTAARTVTQSSWL